MEIKNIVFLVIGVLWYIYKFSKKKKEDAQEGQYDTEPQPQQQKGFQDILDELVGQKSFSETKNPVVALDNFKTEEKEIVTPPKFVEGGIPFDQFERFKEFEIEQELEGNEYTEMFSDQDAARKAFVASAIFNRKY